MNPKFVGTGPFQVSGSYTQMVFPVGASIAATWLSDVLT